ncbi:hypothetical protein, partial [Acetivibrio ethanolgignens]|uniref:hypothetical protein n=1 Tax=Acetivibrio ethanolgignens TaxID=290052 RepID=UPI001A9A5E50
DYAIYKMHKVDKKIPAITSNCRVINLYSLQNSGVSKYFVKQPWVIMPVRFTFARHYGIIHRRIKSRMEILHAKIH